MSLTRARPFAVLAFVLAVGALSIAQSDSTGTALLFGTVYDAHDQPFPGITIVVRNSALGRTWTTTTGSDGSWSLAQMPAPGDYIVTAVRDGNVLDARTGITVNAGDERPILPPLAEPGAYAKPQRPAEHKEPPTPPPPALDILSPEQIKGRDLDSYEKSGPHELSTDRKQRFEVEKPVLREFLWRKWREKHRAYMETLEYGIEGQAGTTLYFVEPDKKGLWHIAILSGEKRYDHETARWSFFEFASLEATFVGRVPISEDFRTAKPIADTAKRSPESYHLIMKNREGRFVVL